MTQEIDETIDHELEYDITESSCETEYPNSLLDTPPYNYIGNYIHQAKSIEPICQTISNLSNDAKYSLLFHHITSPNVLPCRYVRGENRKFNVSWLEKYPLVTK